MSKFTRFEDILAWQKARCLVIDIYEIARTSDLKRDFDLRSQITRAAVSVMSNITEGYERESKKEFSRYLNISRGSCAEVRSQLYILLDLDYINEESFNKLYNQTNEVSKMIFGLIAYLKKSENDIQIN